MCFLFLPSLFSPPFFTSSPLESLGFALSRPPQTPHILVFGLCVLVFLATFSFSLLCPASTFSPSPPFLLSHHLSLPVVHPSSCLSALLLLFSVLTSVALHPLGFGLIVTLLFPFIPRLLLPPICLLSFLFLPPHILFIPPSPPCLHPLLRLLHLPFFFNFDALSVLRLLSCLTFLLSPVTDPSPAPLFSPHTMFSFSSLKCVCDVEARLFVWHS